MIGRGPREDKLLHDKPERSAEIRICAKPLLDLCRIFPAKPMQWEERLKSSAAAEKGFDGVLFVIVSRRVIVFEPIQRVLEGGVDVVDVDDHSFWEDWKNMKEFPLDVALALENVAGVDEEHVASVEIREQFEGNLLNALDDELADESVLVESFTWIRFDVGGSCIRALFAVLFTSGGRDAGAETASDFDVVFRPEMADHGVEGDAVEGWKHVAPWGFGCLTR